MHKCCLTSTGINLQVPTRKIPKSNVSITYRYLQLWIIPLKGINTYPTQKLFTSMFFVFFYKGCQYYIFVTKYFIDRFISTYVTKSNIIKESFLSCTQLGLTCIVEAYVEDYINNAIPNCYVKKHL